MYVAIISALFGAGKLAYGAYQKNKAKKEAENNVMPPYQISSLYGDALGVATQEASYGFSPETLNSYIQTSQQNLTSGAENILRGGGDINDINRLYGIDNNARRNLGFQNDQLKASKLANYFEQNAQLAGQQAISWRLNYFDRWKDRAVASASMMQNGNNLMSSGIDTLGGAVGQFGRIASTQKIPQSNNPMPIDDSWHHNVDNINWDVQPTQNMNTTNWFGQQVNNPFAINNPSQPIY